MDTVLEVSTGGVQRGHQFLRWVGNHVGFIEEVILKSVNKSSTQMNKPIQAEGTARSID